jgi:hypothetical protein
VTLRDLMASRTVLPSTHCDVPRIVGASSPACALGDFANPETTAMRSNADE